VLLPKQGAHKRGSVRICRVSQNGLPSTNTRIGLDSVGEFSVCIVDTIIINLLDLDFDMIHVLALGHIYMSADCDSKLL
jgi:hypothetical protein